MIICPGRVGVFLTRRKHIFSKEIVLLQTVTGVRTRLGGVKREAVRPRFAVLFATFYLVGRGGSERTDKKKFIDLILPAENDVNCYCV